jgi:subtilisin family serine protease
MARARKNDRRDFPKVVFAQASPRSIGPNSLFETDAEVTHDSVADFTSEAGLPEEASARLTDAGFEVLQVSPVTINIAAPATVYERVFETELYTAERPALKPRRRRDTAAVIDCVDTAMSGLVDPSRSALADVLEGIAIEEPAYPLENAFAPLKEYWHLRVPGDVSLGLNADRVHRAGITGRGVKVVMTDSGWYRHPYFVERGYRATDPVLGPGAANPAGDESGHGTGESANVFAAAPDVDFTMVKVSFVNTTGGFNAGAALNPHVMSNSWTVRGGEGPGMSAAHRAAAAAVAAAVVRGIVVAFAAGNGQFGFPGQHPDVIAAGGVYLEANGNMRASSYASGFVSRIFPGRNVPDLSGLVGLVPSAAYIMLPVQAGDQIDRATSGGSHPARDETTSRDGWAAFSGTSAACPQVAGVCALLKQACPRLRPSDVRDILKRTARDVTTGRNAMGEQAAPGYDLATGAGLVDAHRAVLMARVRCLGPDESALAGPSAVVGVRGDAASPRFGEPVMPPSVPAPSGALAAEEVAALEGYLTGEEENR